MTRVGIFSANRCLLGGVLRQSQCSYQSQCHFLDLLLRGLLVPVEQLLLVEDPLAVVDILKERSPGLPIDVRELQRRDNVGTGGEGLGMSHYITNLYAVQD